MSEQPQARITRLHQGEWRPLDAEWLLAVAEAALEVYRETDAFVDEDATPLGWAKLRALFGDPVSWGDGGRHCKRWNGPPPEVVCLCGSTRFAAEFNLVAEELTLAGKIVVRPEVIAYDRGKDPQLIAPEVKAGLDELHKRKIDLADRVLVVNCQGYIGSSTRGEVDYAVEHGVPVDYLEPVEVPTP